MPAVPFQKTPASSKTTWDAAAAKRRIREWAGDDVGKAAKAFAWRPAGEYSFSDLKLPHHDIEGGRLVSVWPGVRAAMAALLGARGGVDIPREDRKSVYNHLAREYRVHGKEPPEFKATDRLVCVTANEVDLSEASTGGITRIQVLREGTFQHPLFGELEFDEEFFTKLVDNFNSRVLGVDIALDIEHRPENGAAGWFRRLYTEDGGLWGDVEWTTLGEELVRGKIYRYVSIEYAPDYVDAETGEEHGPVMIGAALTNRPFIKRMQPVFFSEEIEMPDEIREVSMTEVEEIEATEPQEKEESVLLTELARMFKVDATPEAVVAKVAGLVQEYQKLSEEVTRLQEERREERAQRLLHDALQANKIWPWEAQPGAVMYELARTNPEKFEEEISKRPELTFTEELGSSEDGTENRSFDEIVEDLRSMRFTDLIRGIKRENE